MLVEAGLLLAAEHDNPVDFRGIFTLETLFVPTT